MYFTASKFRRDDAKSLATALYLRKLELKSDAELEVVDMSAFEEDIVDQFKWYTRTKSIKRGSQRRFPSRAELLELPELRVLLHNKYFMLPIMPSEIKTEEPWAFVTYIPSKSVGDFPHMIDDDMEDKADLELKKPEPDPESILSDFPPINIYDSFNATKYVFDAINFIFLFFELFDYCL